MCLYTRGYGYKCRPRILIINYIILHSDNISHIYNNTDKAYIFLTAMFATASHCLLD